MTAILEQAYRQVASRNSLAELDRMTNWHRRRGAGLGAGSASISGVSAAFVTLVTALKTAGSLGRCRASRLARATSSAGIVAVGMVPIGPHRGQTAEREFPELVAVNSCG